MKNQLLNLAFEIEIEEGEHFNRPSLCKESVKASGL
jgi:hypothetical protein